MLNKWVGMGRLVRDPELKTTQSGVSVANFTVAVDRDYKNGDEKIADFVDVTCWRGTADFVSKFMSKGRMVVVSGSLQSRKWQDKDGNNRTNWEIQAENVYFADSKKEGSGQVSAPAPDVSAGGFSDEDEGSELPF